MIVNKSRKFLFALFPILPKLLRHQRCRALLRLPRLPAELSFEVARKQDDLDAAFKLLHHAYVKEGYTKPHASERRVTDYHALPSTTTLVAKWQGKVVGTVSVIRDGPFGLPADQLLNLDAFRAKGQRMGEVSSLAVSPEFRGHLGAVVFYLFKYLLRYSLDCFGLDRFVVVIHPKRLTYYEAILQFVPLQQKIHTEYGFANNAPGVCATIDLKKAPETFLKVFGDKPDRQNMHKFLFGEFSDAEKKQMRFPQHPFHSLMEPVMTPALLDYFFNRCTNALHQLSEKQMAILQSLYDHQAYAPVWPEDCKSDWRNQRSHRRFDVACHGMALNHKLGPVPVDVHDVCHTGLRISSARSLHLHKDLELKIMADARTGGKVKVRPQWRSGCVYGLQLKAADPFWGRLIETLEQQFSKLAQTGPPANTSHSAP